jgi:hypothetical protein
VVAFGLGLLAVALGAAAWLVASHSGELPWPGWVRDLAGRPEPVLVVVVGDGERLRDVRAAIDGGRVVARAADAFALVEGRVIAASFEGVGPLIVEAGWTDRPLEVVAVRWGAPPAWPRETARVADLMSQPTLTLAEARWLLGQL